MCAVSRAYEEYEVIEEDSKVAKKTEYEDAENYYGKFVQHEKCLGSMSNNSKFGFHQMVVWRKFLLQSNDLVLY